MSAEATPIPPHVASEFLVWLWWASEQDGAQFTLPDPVGAISCWVDDRLSFRRPDDTKVSAVLTGERPSDSLEARAALAGGKVVQELRVVVRRDDREFHATLRSPGLDLGGLKLPDILSEGEDERIYDRMFLYGEFMLVLSGLLQRFAEVRTGPTWAGEVMPALRQWLGRVDVD